MTFQFFGWLSIAIGLYGIYSLKYILNNMKAKSKFRTVVIWLSVSHTSFIIFGTVIGVISWKYVLPNVVGFFAIPFFLFGAIALAIGAHKFRRFADKARLR